MQIERDIHSYVADPGPRVAAHRCLGCPECNGTCWHLRELQALPAAVLRARSAGTVEQRQAL